MNFFKKIFNLKTTNHQEVNNIKTTPIDELTQIDNKCPNCKKEMEINERYPKMLCSDCVILLESKDGRKVEYYNTEALGYGCQGYFSGTNQTETYDSEISFLNGKTYIAEEGRFGGIVIQLNE